MTRLKNTAVTALMIITTTAVVATAQQEAPTPDQMPEGPAVRLFERFDTDGDGTITREEVDAAQTARFEAADTDGDGQLSVDEMIAAAEARRLARQQARYERLLERFDANEDGVLSPEEVASAEGPRGDIFDRLDRDEDGVISMAELEERRGFGPGKRHGGGHDRGPGHGKRPHWDRGNH